MKYIVEAAAEHCAIVSAENHNLRRLADHLGKYLNVT
jgi:hypothetical protein